MFEFGRFVSAIFLYKLYQYGYHKPETHIPAIFTLALGNYVIPCVCIPQRHRTIGALANVALLLSDLPLMSC